MEQIAVGRTSPKAFILAPDGETSAYDPENDQIWALSLAASESSPFHLHTSYQLRARSMRVFPNILSGQHRLTLPGDFALPPTVTAYTPSALTIKYTLTNRLQVLFKAFIPESDALVGTIAVMNSNDRPIAFSIEMGTILIPMDQGNPTHPDNIGGNHILSGKTADLYPVLFMSGGPAGTSNPYPALHLPLTLEPGQSEEVQWVLVSKTSQASSFEAARQWVAHNWHRDLHIHTKAHEKKMVFIKTGAPDWDAAFYLAQVNALTHLVNLNPEDKQPTFIRTRLTDQPRRSRDEPGKLSDLTLLDSLHLAQVLLPAHAEHFSRLVENFLNRVDEHGFLPSFAFRSIAGRSIKECPLLATLCLILDEFNPNPEFLKRAFQNLRLFFEAGWLNHADQVHDSLPTWDTPAQLQLDSGLFNFDTWEETGNGLDIRTAESPAMAAMLYREAFALKTIAHILGDFSSRNKFAKWAKRLQEKMHALWNDALKIYSYQDFQTQQAPSRELYYPGRVQPKLSVAKHFSQPQRLQLHLTSQDEHPHNPVVRFEGQNAAGEFVIETVQPKDLRWISNQAHYTTRAVFSTVETVHFEGFNRDDRFLIKTADYTQADITSLLPLWSGGVHREHLTVLGENLLNGQMFGTDFGVPETWHCHHPLPDGLHTPVNIQWNTLIIDGLTREGYSEEAMALFTTLMTTIIRGLKDFNGFYPTFDHETGVPIGAANAITGLAPVGLCLKIAGIKLLSPNRVAIWGQNPFPWPIEVRWQGLWVHKEGEQTQILFPDGTRYHGQTIKPQVVKSRKDHRQP
jgi:hypothetical protein